jgi:hypothetical protein
VVIEKLYQERINFLRMFLLKRRSIFSGEKFRSDFLPNFLLKAKAKQFGKKMLFKFYA